ncbi:hypothetical protein D3G18_08785 [Staphylococcus pseudintermedius]|nr:hypothetical protein [Staphylococcus pseudintermedius]EGQ1767776.1 hypothetical protein [Staphylococcus pseudintermedius]RYR98281.1 hypothetical protein DLS58_11365 [Staphylococcus pseudintermedius]
MKLLITISILGLGMSIVLWIVSKIGLWISKSQKRMIYLKLFHLSYYVLLISVILFIVLLFIG